jgi:hypothetical protein
MASMSLVMLKSIGFSSERATEIVKVIVEAEVISSEMFERMGFIRERAAAMAAAVSLQEDKGDSHSSDGKEGALSLLAAFLDDVNDMPKDGNISQYPRLPKGSPQHITCCVFTLFFCPCKSEIKG